MRKTDRRLFHRYREGETRITAHLDDYAFFIWGLIELYEATFEAGYLKTALELNADMVKHFWDDKVGGFFFTPDDGETLIVRKKEVYDGAVPSGNAVAMFNLLRFASLTGAPDLGEKASKTDKAFSDQIKQSPSAFTQFLVALDFGIGPSYEVVIVGESNARDMIEMMTALNTSFTPNKVVILRPSEKTSPDIDAVAPFVKNYTDIDGKATAYVCVNNTCKLPTTDIKQMLGMLTP